MYIQAIEAMKEFFGPDERWVNHCLEVLGFARQILDGEGIIDDYVRDVVCLSAIFHDIGIPRALEKHGSAAGPLQEKEGEEIAREILTRLETRPDILERVCYIIGHHHTREAIDGADFQLIWEADALVNIPAAWGRVEQKLTLAVRIEQDFRTATGKKLIEEWARSRV